MSWKLHEQYVDLGSGFHVAELRNQQGDKHMLQIALLHDSCPACGAVHPKTNIGELDVAGAIAQAISALNQSEANMLEHAIKHSLKVR